MKDPPNLSAKMASDSSKRLYAYEMATGGWWVPASTGSMARELGVPYDFTHFAITRQALYWTGTECVERVTKGFLGREKRAQSWERTTLSIDVADIEGVAVSRDGFDPSYAQWPREQHLALEVAATSRSQTFYNWATNSADVIRDVAEILSELGLVVDDRAGVL